MDQRVIAVIPVIKILSVSFQAHYFGKDDFNFHLTFQDPINVLTTLIRSQAMPFPFIVRFSHFLHGRFFFFRAQYKCHPFCEAFPDSPDRFPLICLGFFFFLDTLYIPIVLILNFIAVTVFFQVFSYCSHLFTNLLFSD